MFFSSFPDTLVSTSVNILPCQTKEIVKMKSLAFALGQEERQ